MIQLFKILIFLWLVLCGLVGWIGCGIIGFILALSTTPWLALITPLVGGTIAFCTIKYAVFILLKWEIKDNEGLQ